MKKLLLIAACLVATVGALAQGQFTAANKFGTTTAFVTDIDKVTKLAGDAYSAQWYIGKTADSLAPIGAVLPFRTGAAAGYLNQATLTATGIGGGEGAFVQLRAWKASEPWISGQSAVIPITLTVAPATPPFPVGLASFSLIPEPSTIALGLLGAAALLALRRK